MLSTQSLWASLFSTLTSRLATPLPFLFGLLFVAALTTLSRLLVGTLDLSFAFVLSGVLLAYIGLCIFASSLLRLLK